MAAYSTQDSAIAGLIYGSDVDIETKVVASGMTFEFGQAVFLDEGVEDIAYVPDATDTSLKFLGVSTISHRGYTDSEDQYVAFQDINVLTEGQIYVAVASGLTTIANKAAYVIDRITDGQYKKFTTLNSGDTYGIGGYFRSNASDGLARVELRGLN